MGLLSKVSGWLNTQEQRTENKRKIQQYLIWTPNKTAKEISEATGIEIEMTKDILSYMVGAGFVKNRAVDGVAYYSYNKQGHGPGCPCCNGGVFLPI